MPEITITTCPLTPNYDALEAVAKLMLRNYKGRCPAKTRDITVDSGRNLRVKELPIGNKKSLCSCNFTVSNLRK